MSGITGGVKLEAPATAATAAAARYVVQRIA
jgi:hypothetical protein